MMKNTTEISNCYTCYLLDLKDCLDPKNCEKMKTYLAYDAINNEYEEFETIKEAREWLTEIFFDDCEGYHPDLTSFRIYKLEEVVDYDVTDKKENYKYESEEAAEDAEDEEAINNEDYWPYDTDAEEVWKHKFVKQ